MWRQNDGTFQMMRGPVFTNVLLADEINRAPPKSQSALLEAMEERQVTIDGVTLGLDFPFMVIATQNPIEQEGTYPLPEAQLDRFLLKLSTGYPASPVLENDILLRRISWQKDDPTTDIEPVFDVGRFVELQQFVEQGVYTDLAIVDYITQLVRRSREHPRVAVGVSPRGALALLRASRGMALIHGRDFVVPDDVKMLVPDCARPSRHPEYRRYAGGHSRRLGHRGDLARSARACRVGTSGTLVMNRPVQLSWIAVALILLVLGLVLGNIILLSGAILCPALSAAGHRLAPTIGDSRDQESAQGGLLGWRYSDRAAATERPWRRWHYLCA